MFIIFLKKCVLGKNFYLILLVRNVTFLLSKEYVLSVCVGGLLDQHARAMLVACHVLLWDA